MYFTIGKTIQAKYKAMNIFKIVWTSSTYRFGIKGRWFSSSSLLSHWWQHKMVFVWILWRYTLAGYPSRLGLLEFPHLCYSLAFPAISRISGWIYGGIHSVTWTAEVTSLHSTLLHYIALHWNVLHYTALHCNVLHYIALHYCSDLLKITALHCTER